MRHLTLYNLDAEYDVVADVLSNCILHYPSLVADSPNCLPGLPFPTQSSRFSSAPGAQSSVEPTIEIIQDRSECSLLCRVTRLSPQDPSSQTASQLESGVAELLVRQQTAAFLLDCLPAGFVVRSCFLSPAIASWLEGALEEDPSANRADDGIRLGALLLYAAIRGYIAGATASRGGWIGGLADRKVAQALSWLHREPGFDWTVAELARRLSADLTNFSSRFRRLVGVSPIRYLGQWRMLLAERRVREGTETIGDISVALGFQRQSSFGEVFKQRYGVTPLAYRQLAGISER